MTVKLLEPTLIERYVDENGRLTIEGVKLIQRMIAMLQDHEARIQALEP